MARRKRDASALIGALDARSPSEVADALNALAGMRATLGAAQRQIIVEAARKGLAQASR